MLQQQTKSPANLNTNSMYPVGGTTPPAKSKKSMNLRAILTVVGLSLFFVIAMSAVMIAQRQKSVDAPVAPTAPVSKPSATEDLSCHASFTVAMARPESCETVSVSVNGKAIGKGSAAAPIQVQETDSVTYTITAKAGAFTATVKPTRFWAGLYNPEMLSDPNEPRSVMGLCGPSTGAAGESAGDWCKNGLVSVSQWADQNSSTPSVVNLDIAKIFSYTTSDTGVVPSVVQLNAYMADESFSYVSSPVPQCVAYIKLLKRSPDACKNVTLKVNGTATGKGTATAPIEVKDTDVVTYTVVPEPDAFTATVKPTRFWAGLYNPEMLSDPNEPRSVMGLCKPREASTESQGDWCAEPLVMGNVLGVGESKTITLDIAEIFGYTTAKTTTKPEIIQANAYMADAAFTTVSRPVPQCVAYIKRVEEPVVPGVATCLSKEAWTDYSTVATATKIAPTKKLDKGQELVYRVSVAAADGATSGVVTLADALPASLTFVSTSEPTVVKHANGKITADLGIMGTTGKTSKIVEFKVKVKSDATAGATIKNTATISTPFGSGDPILKTCTVTHTIKSDLPDYSCNKPCTTTAQCQTVAQG
ncbi:MAG: isopeptide-forming domain-containing fimbrial protein, partial [Candidatus Pacebacteria bacterium]|nr:isopeptide-forming domain-containing fimbrial protein [Candidatus Paceibacterota bacterium]